MANPEHVKILKEGVEAWNQWRKDNSDVRPDLSEADLSRAHLDFAYLGGADLTWANLTGTGLSRAGLTGADVTGARLIGADLDEAHLRGASLKRANLTEADFGVADLNNSDFTHAFVGFTVFAGNDLSAVKGLETAVHTGPSTIGIDTIYKSKGNIPEAFLRCAGVPEDFITYMKSLAGNPIEFYSCFISYSSKDDDFARRLHADLQHNGVRCWFAPEDLKSKQG